MAIDRKRVLKPVKKLRRRVRNLSRRPDPDEVHKLRTCTRRVEAICEALSSASQGIRKSVTKDLRRCRKRAGKVRDMDVLTEYASTIHLDGEEKCAAQLLEYLGAQRQKYARKLYGEVRSRRSRLRKELGRLATSLDKLIPPDSTGASESAAAPGAGATAAALALHLAEPARLNRGNLHPYRLKVKKLRDLLQISPGGTAFADDLAKAKDAIGEWHDWEELISIAQKELSHGGPCRLVTELKRIGRAKYDNALDVARELRKTYLRGSDAQRSPSSRALPEIPRLPVWEAIAKLAC